MTELRPAIEVAAAKALQAWLDLPAEERSEERPWLMGFNAGWKECVDAIVAMLREYGGANGPDFCPYEFADLIAQCFGGSDPAQIIKDTK